MGPERKRVNTWRIFGFVLGLVVFFAIAFIPSPLHRIDGYGTRPALMAATATLMAVWWFTEALPIAWTACVPLLFFPLLDIHGQGPVEDARRTAVSYVDAYIFLFLGGMALGAAMEQWNLHRRIALHIMYAIGTDPRRLLLGMLVATAAVSMWISNTATAVMMVPIGVALIKQLEEAEGGRRLSSYGAALMLSIAYAANVGGIGTKIGTPTNSLFAGFLSEKLDYELGFVEYMVIGVPFVVLFVPVLWIVLWQLGKRDRLQAQQGRDVLAREIAALGPMSRGERWVAAVFGTAAVLWILGDFIRPWFHLKGKYYEAWVAMLAALFLVAIRGLSFRQMKRIPWGTLVLLGGSFALASGIEGSGLSAWLGQRLEAMVEWPEWQQLLGVSVATVWLSGVASNTATINVMLNVLPPSLPLLAASTLAASCDFALPAGTPPNAIVFGSGYVRMPTMMKVGLGLDVLAALAITGYSLVWIRHVFGG